MASMDFCRSRSKTELSHKWTPSPFISSRGAIFLPENGGRDVNWNFSLHWIGAQPWSLFPFFRQNQQAKVYFWGDFTVLTLCNCTLDYPRGRLCIWCCTNVTLLPRIFYSPDTSWHKDSIFCSLPSCCFRCGGNKFIMVSHPLIRNLAFRDQAQVFK